MSKKKKLESICYMCYPPEKFPHMHKDRTSGLCIKHGAQALGEIEKAKKEYKKRRKKK